MNKLKIAILLFIVTLAGYFLMRDDTPNIDNDIDTNSSQETEESNFEAVEPSVDQAVEEAEVDIDESEYIEPEEPTDNYEEFEENYEDEYQQQDDLSENDAPAVEIEDINFEDSVSDAVEANNLSIDELLESEPIDLPWASETEDRIGTIFTDSDNFVILSESGLDFYNSECRSTVCQINFVPNVDLDKNVKMKQQLALTAFLGQDSELSSAQLNTEYSEEGFLAVKLKFKR